MARKKAVNLSLPEPVMGEFKALTERYRIDQKWMVHTAAMLMFLSASDDRRDFFVREAAAADVTDRGFEAFLERMRKAPLPTNAKLPMQSVPLIDPLNPRKNRTRN